MKNIYISAYPFCSTSNKPYQILNKHGFKFQINNKQRRLKESEIYKILPNFDGIIADTEPLTKKVLKKAKRLKIISRVGIGLNNINLNFAKKKKIRVAYTPDAPTLAVVELTIGLILNALRNITLCNNNLKKNVWKRYLGRRISKVKFGIIGCGRIGSKVLKMLKVMGAKEIYYNDLRTIPINSGIKFKTKNFIFKNCDIISLHLPLNSKTKNLITSNVLKKLKENIIFINTSRGEVINEDHLYNYLKKNPHAQFLLDVFKNEPYFGKLRQLNNCTLTPHIGSMSIDCRENMEIEATKSLVNFFLKKKLKNFVI